MPNLPTNRFWLVIGPGQEEETWLSLIVSEGDLEDAIACGLVDRDDPLMAQLTAAAFYRAMVMNVTDEYKLRNRPWVVVRNHVIIGRNHLAKYIHVRDLAA